MGHVGRMEEVRLPKVMLFGELRKKRPFHGPKRRWRDVVVGDLQAIGEKDGWYQRCQDRAEWRAVCREGVAQVAACRRKNTCSANAVATQNATFACTCGRSFRRRGDLTRHRRFCSDVQ